MRKLASGGLMIALIGVCAASVGGESSTLVAAYGRIRGFRMSEPLLLLLLGMCLIVLASVLPPRLRGRFRARSTPARQDEISLQGPTEPGAEETNSIGIRHRSASSERRTSTTRSKGSAAGVGG